MRMLTNQGARMAEMLAQHLAIEAPDIDVTWLDTEGHPQGPTDDAEILFRFNMSVKWLATALQSAPALRWVHTGSAGVDRILPLVREYGPPGVVLTNGSGAMALPIAEYCLGQMIAVAKSFPIFWRAQADHTWLGRDRSLPPARELAGLRVLVLGLGSIGQEVARLATAAGMRVWGVRRRPLGTSESIAGVDRVFGQDEEWRQVLPTMEFVISSLPLTEATRGILGAPEFAAMQPTAWVINISRGDIIDEPALIAALSARRIGGAALDVMHTEPLPPDSPLWELPNVILTPHVSWNAPAVDDRILDLFIENLRRYRAGEPLVNVVPPEVGY